jgi:hypothetical protein
MRFHEFEDFAGIESVSRANEAAAFGKMSRSISSCRMRLLELNHVFALARPAGMLRPDRTSSMTLYRNSGRIGATDVFGPWVDGLRGFAGAIATGLAPGRLDASASDAPERAGKGMG